MAVGKDLDRLLAGVILDRCSPGARGLLDGLRTALSERVLNAELDAPLDVDRAEERVGAKPTG